MAKTPPRQRAPGEAHLPQISYSGFDRSERALRTWALDLLDELVPPKDHP